MPTAQLAELAASNHWLTLWPEMAVALLAVVLLVLELTLPRTRHVAIGWVAVAGTGIILAALLASSTILRGDASAGLLFGGLLQQTPLSEGFRAFFLATALLVLIISQTYLQRQAVARIEYQHIVLLGTLGLMLLVQSVHFVMLFVALELVAICFYVLVSYTRQNVLTLEGGLKYFVMSALSSALLLFGIALLHAAAAEALSGALADPMSFRDVGLALAAQTGSADDLLALTGALLVIAGICFKMGVVPFQIWVPDVYQGAPTPTTAFLAIGSKAGGVAVLLALVLGPFASLNGLLVPLFSAMAAMTILYGNFTALNQRQTKRLLGLSGIAHAGYLMIGVVAAFSVPSAPQAIFFYLCTYLLAVAAVALVIALTIGPDDTRQELEDYEDFHLRHPFFGTVLIVALGSLAGIPPLAGFVAKFALFTAAFEAGLYVLLAVAVVGVVVSIYYYFGWMVQAVSRTLHLPPVEGELPVERPELGGVKWPERVALGVVTLLTVLVGLIPGLFGAFAQ